MATINKENSTTTPPKPARILIVDDSAEMRHLYARYLKNACRAFEISEAGNVTQALAMLSARSYDCVVLDYHLPGETGLDLLQRISDEDGRCPVPVVMITGQGNETVAVQAMKLGACDYLVKNRVTATGLDAAIGYAMQKSESDRARYRYQRELERQSVSDSLTGLRNRRYLSGFIESEISRAARYGSPLSVLMIDLDHFKQVNDTYGHAIGDRVLRNFASLLTRLVRATDVVARYGGEEFCVVLCETAIDGAEHLAERINSQARALRHDDGRGGVFYVSCSVGVVVWNTAMPDGDTLIASGDEALYRAKRGGRDRYCVYETRERSPGAVTARQASICHI